MLSFEQLEQALLADPLFDAKTWRLSPEAWKLDGNQLRQIEQIGESLLELSQEYGTALP